MWNGKRTQDRSGGHPAAATIVTNGFDENPHTATYANQRFVPVRPVPGCQLKPNTLQDTILNHREGSHCSRE